VSLSSQMNRGEDIDDTIRQRSGWLIPIGVFAVTAILSAAILLYYLAPTPASFIEDRPAPTSSTDPIILSVGVMRLTIPANYILYKSARRDGPQTDVALIAAFPDFRGYTDWQSQLFVGNAADSPVIYMLIREEPLNLTEAEKLQRIYMNFVTDPAGRRGPFDLTQYTFRSDSGYRGEDLFVGETPAGPVVLQCVRFSQQVPSPSCLRDMRLKRGVALSYRFKRAHLADWREIASGIGALIQSFHAHAK
jgi:hypothetical protein